MATTLAYGFIRPDNGDKGASLFADLVSNIERVDAHIHNGTDSTKLPSSSLAHSSQTVAAANWADPSNGVYKQTITTTGGLDADEYGILFVDSTGKRYHLSTERISATQYYVFSNDNTLELSAIYL